MATNLNLDSKISAIENLSNTSTGLRNLLQDFINSAFHSSANPFGTAALKDASKTKVDTVALTDDSGNFDITIIPEINTNISSTFDTDRVPGMDVSKVTSGEFASNNLASAGNNGDVLTKTSLSQSWQDVPEKAEVVKSLPSSYPNNRYVVNIGSNPGIYQRRGTNWSKV